jgi:flavin reductase (DIM6/NTAB) family NADH-FMN oxidoreductase RutF
MQNVKWNEALELASPYPYALVTTLDRAHKPNIIGIAWWSFVSWDPPMAIISVGPGRYSHQCLEHCKEFGLCFPAEDQAKGAWLCGKVSGRDTDKFKEAGFDRQPAEKIAPPLIADCTVAFECRVKNQMKAGDHDIFLGEIVGIHGDPKKVRHLYSVHYRKLVSIDHKGGSDFNIDYI